MTKYLAKCTKYYEDNLLPKFGIPNGSTNEEISTLENSLGISFPIAYRQFLLWMGADFSGIFKGSNWYLRDVTENTECLNEFLDENDVDYNSESQRLCFFSHQGYMSAWFEVPSKTEDPECYFYSEAFEENEYVKIDSFSEFLLTELSSIKTKF